MGSVDLSHAEVMELKRRHAEAKQELPCCCNAKNHLDLTRPVRTRSECMKAYNKAYRDKHSGMMTCPCGAEFKEISKYTHIKSARHQQWAKGTG
jgi:hypothetical protein